MKMDVTSLTLDEMDIIEDIIDRPFDDIFDQEGNIKGRSVKVIKAFMTILKLREDGKGTDPSSVKAALSEVGKMRMAELELEMAEPAPVANPTEPGA